MIATRKKVRSSSALLCALTIAFAAVPPFLIGQENNRAQDRLQAMALEQQGRNPEAEQIWDSIAKADPANAEALAHLGLLEARQERYGPAIEYYRRAVAINADLPNLQMNLGLALFKIDQFPDAIRSFSSELLKHPGDQRLTILIGMAHYGMKDYLVAIPYLKRAAEHDPQNASLRLTLAHSCMASRQYQCVLEEHKEILDLKAESAEADLLAGETLDQLQDRSGAEKQFRAAAQITPSQPNVHFGLGYLLWTQGKWAEAAIEFQLELQNDPSHLKARVYLADSWVHQNQFAKALPELEKLVAADPSDPLTHRDLGIIFADQSQSQNAPGQNASGQNASGQIPIQNALRELNAAIDADPTDEESHRLLAHLYQATGKVNQATAELDKAKHLPQQNHATLREMIDSIENPAP